MNIKKIMYTVRLFPDWTDGQSLAKLWKERGQIVETSTVKLWDLGHDQGRDPDYYVIINKGKHQNGQYLKITDEMAARTIIFYMEPRRTGQPGNWGRKSWGDEWATPDPAKFLQVRDFHYYPNNSEWHVDHPLLNTVDQESESEVMVKEDNVVTAVVSSYNWDPGHKLRLAFLHFVESRAQDVQGSKVQFKIWGRCQSENFVNYQGEIHGGKDVALLPYRYHFNAENNSERNYFTEKIIDPIMTECLCFYWGCPNLSEWIDKDSFVYVDLEQPEIALATIQECIAENAWQKRLPAIRRAKQQIYECLTIVPTLDRILMAAHCNFLNGYFDQIIVINLDESTDRWKNMEAQFQAVGVKNYVRLSATNREIAEQLVIEGSWKLPTAHVGRPGINRRAQLGQLGCKISHWRAVAMAKKKKWQRVLIVEDDVIITPNGVQRFNLAMQETIDREIFDWQLLWVFGLYYSTTTGYSSYSGQSEVEKRTQFIDYNLLSKTLKSQGDLVHQLSHSCSTVCYGISESCYDQVLDEIQAPENGEFPIDDLYNKRLHPKLRAYIMHPCPFGADLENESTITAERQVTESDFDQPVQKAQLAKNANSRSEETGSSRPAVLNKSTQVLQILTSQVEEMLDKAQDKSQDKVEPYEILQFWNRQVRPHLGRLALKIDGGADKVKEDLSKLVTRLLSYFEKYLDQEDVHQFLWNAHDIDGLDYIEKVCDILHVTSYYQDYDALSIRAAASLQNKLMTRGASKSHIDDLDFNAKFARDRFHNRLENTEADLAEKMKICGFQSWVINLDRRLDRYQGFQEKARAVGVEDSGGGIEHLVHRFSAVDGQGLQRTKKLEHLFRNNDFGSNRGALGAALSHLTLWKHLVDGDADAPRVKKKQLPPKGKAKAKVADTFLIFEDDVQLYPQFSDGRWITAYERLNIEHPDWDTCFLAFIPAPPRKIEDFLDTNSDHRAAEIRLVPLTPEMTWGGFSAYLINRKGACKMVRFIEKHGIKHGIDYILMRMQHEDLQMENYLMVPNPCFAQWVTGTNDGVDTDIQKKQDPW